MKTVITAAGNNVSAAFDKRFGRAAWFCVYDHANGALAFEKMTLPMLRVVPGLKSPS